MAKCTAPREGHRTSSGAEACPACRGRYGRYGGGYSSYGSSPSSYSSSYTYSPSRSNSSSSVGSSSGRSTKPRWSRTGSSVVYTPAEVQTLTPFREKIEKLPPQPDRRDVFLCHAWNDRKEAARELHDLLEARKVSVWFSEKDVILGTSLLREIDKGLAKSRVGIVLVTPAFLERIQGDGSIADKELSALLARDQLIPIVHNTTYEELREVSPLLASRSGLTTGEDQNMEDVADKIAELVAP
ncbi:MAG: toll/interleukin-1 receptor domain-containing protein [Cyanobacteria bacterium TGS_CYA1]|nr:toll/interleukin-1 receptor domain-containing protein [Cyanobacteria bacterium TGS_CYA1]